MPTDISEKGLETLIMRHLTGTDGLVSNASGVFADVAPRQDGSGWFARKAEAYDREFAVDVAQLFTFLQTTQPKEVEKLGISNYGDQKGVARRKFLARLPGEISRREMLDVLRHGIKHGPLSFDLFHGTPSPENAKAVERHTGNRLSIAPASIQPRGDQAGAGPVRLHQRSAGADLRTEEQPDPTDGGGRH